MNEFPNGAHHEPHILRFPQATPTAPAETKPSAPTPEPEATTRTVLVFSPRPGARQLLADDVRKPRDVSWCAQSDGHMED